jgi:hypothetical protein
MSTNDFKKIVQLIKKTAGDFDDKREGPGQPAIDPKKVPSRRTAPNAATNDFAAPRGSAATDPKATEPKATGAGYSKDPEIVKMQDALINLATTVSNQLNTKVERNGLPLGLNTPDEAHKPASGQTSFSDFIVNRYMGGSDAQQASIDTAAIKYDPKTHSTPNRMLGIMNTMSRIGSTDIKGQFTPDGKWGPKTNDGLKNAKAFGTAMLQLADDFKIQGISSYDTARLQGFVTRKDDTDWSPSEKHDAAPTLTSHIKMITSLFNEVKEKLLNNPETKKYIEGKKPYVTYKKIVKMDNRDQGLKDSIAKTRFKIYDIDFQIRQPSNENGTIKAKINFQDLVSPENFDKWLTSSNLLNQPGVTKDMIISAIRLQLKTKVPQGAK